MQFDQHELQDWVLLGHVERKHLRLHLLADVLAERLVGAEGAYALALVLVGDEVHDVDVSAFQILLGSELTSTYG